MKPLRCLLGFHQWHKFPVMGWVCNRCGKEAPRCRNCGGQHDPTAYLVVCRVVTCNIPDCPDC